MKPASVHPGEDAAGLDRSGFSEEQIRRVARYLALLKIAVERGQADRSQLRRLLTPAAYAQQFDPAVARFVGGPLASPADLGATRITVLSPRRALIAVAARETAERWGALLIDLRVTPNGRLLVAELLRAQDRVVTLAPDGEQRPVTVPDLQQQMRELLAERQLTRDAHRAAAARVARLSPGPRGAAARAVLAPEADRWATHLEHVDAELGALTQRLDATGGAGLSAGSPERLIGFEPSDGSRWAGWRRAYLELRAYQGWHRTRPHSPIPDPTPPPGPQPAVPTPTSGLPRLEL